jgi:muconate cycloisomerase
MKLSFERLHLPKIHALAISRGITFSSENLFVSVSGDGVSGIGELVGTNALGGETCDTGIEQLRRFWEHCPPDLAITEIWRRAREAGVRPRALAALEVALWDRFAKLCGQPLWRLFGLPRQSVPTSITVGLNPPAIVREEVTEMLQRTGCRYLKIKLGSKEGLEADQASFVAAAAAARPFAAGLRVDANGGWTLADAKRLLPWLAERGVDYVEQPLPQGAEDQLPELFRNRPLPIFVDESCNLASDVPGLADRVDGINLKLMKTGGLTEALRLVATARAHGLQTMLGCMGESSIAISAAACIGALFDHLDLDSHLNLREDPAVGAPLVDGVVLPTDQPGHGARLTQAGA